MPLHTLDRAPARDIKDTALGRFAARLRHYMCTGQNAALLRSDMEKKLYAAFAAVGQGDRSIDKYKTWAGKFATREYADELVVAAVALELQIKIVCVPHTPVTAGGTWAITKYQPPNADLADDHTVVLGNNDVHSMWLASV